ncbi:sel1 repeat family protein [Achromobacter insolitus]|uniref:sel1 repeat family protein n=1 Tax=Achromobacter insolitus TaxID=217204 RepID=UPI002420131E|nr:sel1 repeat family protein [Achromobacter insolitus]
MTRKALFVSTFVLLLCVALTALFWRYQFAHMPSSLRSLVEGQVGEGMHIYGESPRKDREVERALLAEAQRGNAAAQYMQGMVLEQLDMAAALRWYEAAAAQGYEAAIQRLRQLREQALANQARP